MSPRKKFLLTGTLIIIVLKLFVFRAHAQTEPAGNAVSTAKMFGDVRLTSDSIEHGLTQTDHSFALQTTLGYQWPQFRTGIWGSNVKYPTSSESLNLRLFFATKIPFSTNTDLDIRYDFNRYFKGGNHDGGLLSFDLRLFDYHVLYDQNDNFEALQSVASRWGFMHSWQIPFSMILNLNAGYNMLQAQGYTNYFDVVTQVQYKWSDLTYAFGNSFNSAASQFGDRGAMAFFFSIGAKF